MRGKLAQSHDMATFCKTSYVISHENYEIIACHFCAFITDYSVRLYFKSPAREHEQIQTKQDTVRDEILCLLRYQHRDLSNFLNWKIELWVPRAEKSELNVVI